METSMFRRRDYQFDLEFEPTRAAALFNMQISVKYLIGAEWNTVKLCNWLSMGSKDDTN